MKWSRPRPCFPVAVEGNERKRELEATYAEARDAFKGGDYTAALQRYMQAASTGEAAAQIFVGWMITSGMGMPAQEPAEGEKWYLRAAGSGSHEAYFWLGDYHERTRDYGSSKQYLIKAAKLGSIPAHFRLGLMSLRADSRIMSEEEAVHWLSLASSKGHAYADSRLAYLIFRGKAPGGYFRAMWLFLRGILRAIYYVLSAPPQERPLSGESQPCLRL